MSLEAQLPKPRSSQEAAEVRDFLSQTRRLPSPILLLPWYEKVIPKAAKGRSEARHSL